MLHALREWLTAVVSVTLLLSLLRALTPEGTVRSAASFAGGLALAAVLLRPLAGDSLSLPDWDGPAYRAELEAEQAAAEDAWREAVAEEVRSRTEAAVRRKAADMGTVRSVRVEVRAVTENSGVPLPWTAVLSGERDAALAAWIADALGIPPERQTWTG